jgi:hypothetical protein
LPRSAIEHHCGRRVDSGVITTKQPGHPPARINTHQHESTSSVLVVDCLPDQVLADKQPARSFDKHNHHPPAAAVTRPHSQQPCARRNTQWQAGPPGPAAASRQHAHPETVLFLLAALTGFLASRRRPKRHHNSFWCRAMERQQGGRGLPRPGFHWDLPGILTCRHPQARPYRYLLSQIPTTIFDAKTVTSPPWSRARCISSSTIKVRQPPPGASAHAKGSWIVLNHLPRCQPAGSAFRAWGYSAARSIRSGQLGRSWMKIGQLRCGISPTG